MTNPATPADVVSRWRPLDAQEATNAETFLGDAWLMLRRHLERHDVDIAVEIADDEDLRADVVRVLCAAVLRVLKNPEGKRQESIDDYSYTRDSAVSGGLLHFTDDELRDLMPGVSGSGGVFSVNLLANWSPQ